MFLVLHISEYYMALVKALGITFVLSLGKKYSLDPNEMTVGSPHAYTMIVLMGFQEEVYLNQPILQGCATHRPHRVVM